MLNCQVCGRWIASTAWSEHEAGHDLQLMLDHTGPHGRCLREKQFATCKCPDPILTTGHYVCTCCEGVLAVQEEGTWVGI